MNRRTFCIVALVALPALWVLCPGEPPADAREPGGGVARAYKLNDAPYTVVTVGDLVLTDLDRDKELPLTVYYPEAEGPFPLIVFLHGMGGDKDGCAPLANHWASHGYVVACPTHADSIALRKSQGKSPGFLAGIRSINQDAGAWEDRAKDISLVIDSSAEIEKVIGKGMIDEEHIGVGGHSFGAFTTMLIGGALVDLPDGTEDASFRDERADCLLVLSGQGIGRMGLDEHSWDGLDLPVMWQSGTLDYPLGGGPPEERLDAFDHCAPGNKYSVWIDDALHMSFSGQALEWSQKGKLGNRMFRRIFLAGLSEEEFFALDHRAVFDVVLAASTAFWDAYLKDDTAALDYLRGGGLAGYAGAVAELELR